MRSLISTSIGTLSPALRRPAGLLTLTLALTFGPGGTASASPGLVIRGAGFGHGVGMSQYGAYGYARHGRSHRFILGHYYSHTTLGHAAPGRTVRVILQANAASVSFRGARRAAGRSLDPGTTYRVTRSGDSLLFGGSVVAAPLRIEGDGRFRLLGRSLNGVDGGVYRGALELRPGVHGGINAIDAVDLDDYVRGVVAGEMPAEWPSEALATQAVAARTYAITTDAAGVGFEQWPDTRSQVYRGVAGEHPRAEAAVRATQGEIVLYRGRPATTFFFSTSGGRTEDVELAFSGSSALPWLRSVDDPYDSLSSLHRWTIRRSPSEVVRRLSGLIRGSFRGIRVARRGRSPRVVSAFVVGTGGSTAVSGTSLAARLGLYDSWAYFNEPFGSADPTPAPQPPTPASAQGATGGLAFGERAAPTSTYSGGRGGGTAAPPD